MTNGRPPVLLMGDTLSLGGTEGQFTEVACRLDRSRWDVEIACVRPEGPLLARLEAEGLRPSAYGPSSYKSPLLLGAIVALARHIKAHGFAVVHSFGFYANILALPAGRLAGVPALIGSQRDLGNLRSPMERAIHRLALRLATHVLVNSEVVKEQVTRVQGIGSSRVTVIANGVDVERFSPGRVEARAGDGLVVGAVSNLRPEKGLADLVRAVGMVRGRGRDVRLVICGEGPLRGDLERLVAQLNLQSVVSLPGSTPVPEDALRGLDIFVLPSLSEACSNGLMEAMATALPVIATSVGGNPGLVTHEVTGLLVPPSDPAALAEAIVRLSEDRALARRLGNQARTHAQDTLGMQRMVAGIEALYARGLGMGAH